MDHIRTTCNVWSEKLQAYLMHPFHLCWRSKSALRLSRRKSDVQSIDAVASSMNNILFLLSIARAMLKKNISKSFNRDTCRSVYTKNTPSYSPNELLFTAWKVVPSFAKVLMRRRLYTIDTINVPDWIREILKYIFIPVFHVVLLIHRSRGVFILDQMHSPECGVNIDIVIFVKDIECWTQCPGQNCWVLRYNGHSTSQISQSNFWYVYPINLNATFRRLNKTEEAQSQCGLATTGSTNNANLLSRGHFKRNIMEDARKVGLQTHVSVKANEGAWGTLTAYLMTRFSTLMDPCSGQEAAGLGSIYSGASCWSSVNLQRRKMPAVSWFTIYKMTGKKLTLSSVQLPPYFAPAARNA